jgi:hypothetical protein
MSKKVFVSGPYTLGDVAVNVKNAMDVGNDLINMGYYPFVPHLSHFMHMANPQPYETWLFLDLKFLECCDARIRIGGESNGADKEVAHARKLGIPVYFNLWDLTTGKKENFTR